MSDYRWGGRQAVAIDANPVAGTPIQAICFRCGSAKASALAGCPACAQAPRALDERARSFVLTRTFYDGTREFGRSDAELEALAGQIRRGEAVAYDAGELAAVSTSLLQAEATTPRERIFAFARWTWPLALAALAWLWYRNS
jgi:hypothetical protein